MKPRDLLAENFKALLKDHPHLGTLPKVTAASGISNGTLDRIRRAEVATTVDVLGQLAEAYGLEAWELLVPPRQRQALHHMRLAAEATAAYQVNAPVSRKSKTSD